MRPVAVVMVDVLMDDGFEVTAANDEYAIEALPTDGADKAIGKRVCSRSVSGLPT
jgi:hypothetical protein